MATWTAEDVEKLETAIANRAKDGLPREIQFSGRLVRFDSIDEALKLLSIMRREVNPSREQSSRLAAFSKGL